MKQERVRGAGKRISRLKWLAHIFVIVAMIAVAIAVLLASPLGIRPSL